MMNPDDAVRLAIKLRRQGAKRVELTADGGLVVDFDGPLRIRTRATKPYLRKEDDPNHDPIEREPRFTQATIDALQAKLDAEYLP